MNNERELTNCFFALHGRTCERLNALYCDLQETQQVVSQMLCLIHEKDVVLNQQYQILRQYHNEFNDFHQQCVWDMVSNLVNELVRESVGISEHKQEVKDLQENNVELRNELEKCTVLLAQIFVNRINNIS